MTVHISQINILIKCLCSVTSSLWLCFLCLFSYALFTFICFPALPWLPALSSFLSWACCKEKIFCGLWRTHLSWGLASKYLSKFLSWYKNFRSPDTHSTPSVSGLHNTPPFVSTEKMKFSRSQAGQHLVLPVNLDARNQVQQPKAKCPLQRRQNDVIMISLCRTCISSTCIVSSGVCCFLAKKSLVMASRMSEQNTWGKDQIQSFYEFSIPCPGKPPLSWGLSILQLECSCWWSWTCLAWK